MNFNELHKKIEEMTSNNIIKTGVISAANIDAVFKNLKYQSAKKVEIKDIIPKQLLIGNTNE